MAETLVMTCGAAIRAASRLWAAADTDVSLDERGRRAALPVREANVKSPESLEIDGATAVYLPTPDPETDPTDEQAPMIGAGRPGSS